MCKGPLNGPRDRRRPCSLDAENGTFREDAVRYRLRHTSMPWRRLKMTASLGAFRRSIATMMLTRRHALAAHPVQCASGCALASVDARRLLPHTVSGRSCYPLVPLVVWRQGQLAVAASGVELGSSFACLGLMHDELVACFPRFLLSSSRRTSWKSITPSADKYFLQPTVSIDDGDTSQGRERVYIAQSLFRIAGRHGQPSRRPPCSSSRDPFFHGPIRCGAFHYENEKKEREK